MHVSQQISLMSLEYMKLIENFHRENLQNIFSHILYDLTKIKSVFVHDSERHETEIDENNQEIVQRLIRACNNLLEKIESE